MQPSIVASNLVCPVGLAAAPACAAMRAGLRVFEESELLGPAGTPVVCSAISRVPKSRSIRPRLEWMLSRAFAPLLDESLLGQLAAPKLPLLVGFLERPRRGGDERLARRVLDEAITMLGARSDEPRSQLFFGGAPSGFRAMARARELLEGGDVPACIVLALDSWLDARSLLWLSEQTPLQTGKTHGVIPGEAAAALLLAAPGVFPRTFTQAHLLALGFGEEPSAKDPAAPLRGDGLRDAVAGALGAHADLGEVDLRMSDNPGTHAGAKEQMLLLARLLRAPIAELPLWLPAESLGHVGAAAGLAQVIWAIQASARGYLPGPRVLCMASNFSGERGAALVEVTGCS